MMMDGRNKVFSYVPSQKGKYYIISEIEYIQSISDLLKTTNILTTVVLIIFLLAILISAFIAYILYKPFGNIVGNIRNMFEDSLTKNNLNEVQLLSHTFTKMVDKLNSLEKENDNNAIIKMFFSHSVTEDISSDILIRNGILEEESSYYRIIVIKIDGFKKLCESNNQEAIMFQLNSVSTIVSGYFDNTMKCTSFTIEDDRVVLIISKIDDKGKLNSDVIKALMNEAKDTVCRVANISITIGISLVSNDVYKINEKYKEACECTNYRLFLGKGSVISTNMINESASITIPENIVQQALNAVKTSDKNGFDILINDIFKICGRLQFEDAVKYLANLAVSIIELSKDILHEDNSLENINYLETYNAMLNLDDPNDLKALFISFYDRVNVIINDLNNKKTQNILIDVIEYIHKNYYDSQISANSMAEKLSISTQYFSKIFNEYTGCSLPEYINNIRLERAKRMLLENMDLDICDIADKVGYGSNTYFTTSFKKKFGVTPSKMRINRISQKH